MQVFRGKVCAVLPGDGISFQSKLSEIVDVFQRNEDRSSQRVGEINFPVSAVIEPKTDAMISNIFRFDDVQHGYFSKGAMGRRGSS